MYGYQKSENQKSKIRKSNLASRFCRLASCGPQYLVSIQPRCPSQGSCGWKSKKSTASESLTTSHRIGKPEQKARGTSIIKPLINTRVGTTTGRFCVRQTPTAKPQKVPCGHFKLALLRYQGALLQGSLLACWDFCCSENRERLNRWPQIILNMSPSRSGDNSRPGDADAIKGRCPLDCAGVAGELRKKHWQSRYGHRRGLQPMKLKLPIYITQRLKDEKTLGQQRRLYRRSLKWDHSDVVRN